MTLAIEIQAPAEKAHLDAEYLLSALRAATLRARLAQVELETIGIAVRGKMLSPADAVAWLESLDAIDYLPGGQ
jgi:hypothetical protein